VNSQQWVWDEPNDSLSYDNRHTTFRSQGILQMISFTTDVNSTAQIQASLHSTNVLSR